MNAARWSIGQVSLHGMASTSARRVTHPPGLPCYPSARSVPMGPTPQLASLGRALRARQPSASNGDQDLAALDLALVDGDLRVVRDAVAGPDVELPGVPWTREQAALELAFAE